MESLKSQYGVARRIDSLMLGAALVSTLLLPAASALANDIRPGLWEIKQSMESEHLPEQMTREQVQTQCVSTDDAADMAAAMRQRWQQINCADMNIERDGNTISIIAECSMSGRTTSVDGEVTIHDQEHYSSKMITTNDATLTTDHEAHWVAEECPNSAE